MKVGDLVKADDWVVNTQDIGLIVKIQPPDYCRGAWVLFKDKIQLIRVENLKVIYESR